MNNKKTKLDEFKETLHQGMIKNFENDGYLTPVVFFFIDEKPIISEIPNELLNTPDGKIILANSIRLTCSDPNTKAGGMIIEAYGAKIDNNTQEATDILKGKKRVSELNNKQDIIIMIFSTPDSEEMISYIVDPNTKTIMGKFIGKNADEIAGTFSSFFDWKKMKEN